MQDTAIDQLRDLLIDQDQVTTAYLFGSAVRDVAQAGDLDVAVAAELGQEPRRRQR